jgi:hypothetical protein
VRGRLVGLGDAGQILQLARERPLVLAGLVARDELIDRAVDEDLDKAADLAPGLVAHFAVRALHRRLEDDPAAPRDQAADPGEPLDLCVALILGGRAADAQHLRDIGGVEDLGAHAEPLETLRKGLRQGALAGASHPGEPNGKPVRRHPHAHRPLSFAGF